MFLEVCRITRLLAIVLVGALQIRSAGAQEKTGSIESATALVKDLKPAGLTQTGVRIQPVQPNGLVRSLYKSQHAIMSPPPLDIVTSLAEASLPANSPKEFLLRGISRADFLAPTKVQPTDWQQLKLPRVNASELQNDKRRNAALPE